MRAVTCGVVAVIPVCTATCPYAAWDRFAATALVALEAHRALRITVTLADASIEALCVVVVASREGCA